LVQKLLCGESTQITEEHNQINLFPVIKEAKRRLESTQHKERKTGIYYSQAYFLSASPAPIYLFCIIFGMFLQ
jgi:hypothetical protein